MMERKKIIQETEQWLLHQNFRFSEKDLERPWGAFWHIQQEDTCDFLHKFFPDRSPVSMETSHISPKILLVLPHQRLSLQIHRKRSECWTILRGPVEIVLGTVQQRYYPPKQLTIPVETPHRLIGLDEPGLVAEIWIHEDPLNPSSEEDIERVEDDYQRN